MHTASDIAVDHQLPALSVRDKWGWFLALGIVLILCGIFAVTVPSVTSMAASLVLGVVLVVVGLVRIIEAFKVKEWGGFLWQLMSGMAEVIGGVMIYLSPFMWALAITLLAAIVFAVQGIAQIGLALKVRPQPGWAWLVLAGIVALCATVALAMKFPYTRYYNPSTIAGISLFISGFAYIVIAFAIRKIR